MSKMLRLISLLLLLSSKYSSFGLSCKKIDDCSCMWHNGSITTLSEFGVRDEVRFANVTDPFGQGVVYSYNPCYAFSNGTKCTNASVCSFYPSGLVIQYGNQESATFDMEKFGDTDDLALTLTYTNPSPLRKAKLYIICAALKSPLIFQILGPIPENPPLLEMYLSHHTVCPTTQPHPLPIVTTPQTFSVSLSVGSILCISLAGILVVYVVGGMVIQKVLMKREGLEVIPNFHFWYSLPGYVKDGMKFPVDAIRGR